MKSGFVAIIGKPNAGKSTLLNEILGRKLAIVTPKAQTTRNAIYGILNEDELQIIFIDTPGIHDALTSLGSYMNKEAYAQASEVDVIYYIVDGNKGLSKDDKNILDKLFSYKVPVFLLVNKIDELSDNDLISRLAYANENYNFQEILPISALKGNNIKELIDTTCKYLNDNQKYFPDDQISNISRNFYLSEIIREKVIFYTEQEVPHLVACKIEEVIEKENKVLIEATIICNKQSHKGIIIGRNGKMLKKINDASSMEMKNYFNKKVVLSLYVKVIEDWLNKDNSLFELGYFRDDINE